ncbi:MAG: lipid A biosynthesis acyltransferase [Sedimenticola sp.]|nr:MAG: lipid A biosynthesis acyltransferase [Sedimenticola sp.]
MRAKIIFNLVRLLGCLPLPLLQGFGSLVGRLFYYLPNRETRNARINIGICFPELDEAAQRRLLKQSLIENGKTLFEMPLFWLNPPQHWIDRVEVGNGYEIFQAALAEERGLIIAGPHLGNWEATVQYLASQSKMTAIYRPPKLRELDELVRQGRSRTGATLVPATPQGVKQLLKALKSGEMLGILCDQQPKATGEQGAVFAPFFGQRALTMVMINRLAKRTGARVIFCYTERLKRPGRFSIHWCEGSEALLDEDPLVSATAMNRIIEQCIRQCPEQYIWSYKRFSEQPPGTSSPYQ